MLAELRRSLRLMTEFRDLIRREVTSGSPEPSDATSGRDTTVARELLRLAPMSQRLSADDPPPAGTTRWVRSRKLAVVAAILDGRLTVEEACTRYDLTAEELVAWREMADAQRRPG